MLLSIWRRAKCLAFTDQTVPENPHSFARSLVLLERKVGRDRLVVGTNLAGWDSPKEPAEIPFVDAYDDNARRLLRLS